MNVERIRKLADALEHRTSPIAGFDMGEFVTDNDGDMLDIEALKCGCGSAACIAGHTIAMFPELVNSDRWYSISDAAGRILGLDYRQKAELFYAYGAPTFLDNLTREEAVQTLRHLADTGEVVWFNGERE